ncbi:hypothetical protein Tco_1581325, partial [Tanacetum coccineum]
SDGCKFRRMQIQTDADSDRLRFRHIQTDSRSDRCRQVQSIESHKYGDEREQNRQTSIDSDSRQTTDKQQTNNRQTTDRKPDSDSRSRFRQTVKSFELR